MCSGHGDGANVDVVVLLRDEWQIDKVVIRFLETGNGDDLSVLWNNVGTLYKCIRLWKQAVLWINTYQSKGLEMGFLSIKVCTIVSPGIGENKVFVRERKNNSLKPGVLILRICERCRELPIDLGGLYTIPKCKRRDISAL
jgi:hypothetical protein